MVTNELHLCNLCPVAADRTGIEQMGQHGNGAQATEPELDSALARAIRQLIAEAVDNEYSNFGLAGEQFPLGQQN
jgi:hypothetical protein